MTDVTSGWRAAREWLTSNGQPDVARLAALFGSHEVTVHCRSGAPRETTVAEYARWWLDGREDDSWRYLKDWHLAQSEPDINLPSRKSCRA